MIISDFLNIYKYKKFTFSQDGEDIILKRLFGSDFRGFYVDVGAHHPYRFSNTYLLYRRGWHGINIDASLEGIKLFKKFRPNDVNVHAGISKSSGKSKFYIFEEEALNTFDPKTAQRQISNGQKLRETQYIDTKTLASVLGEHMPIDTNIDILNIDVEGLDLEVLQSNEWNRFKPIIIILEQSDLILSALDENEAYCLLKNLGYELLSKTFNTAIYRLTNNKQC